MASMPTMGVDEGATTDTFGLSSDAGGISSSAIGPYGMAAMGAGDLLSGIGAVYAGETESNALSAEANLQKQNAQLDLQAGNANATRSQILSGQKIGALQGSAAASGVTQSGSVLSLMAASSMNAEMDRQNILHGEQVKAVQAENQASMDDMGAQSALNGFYLKAFGDVAQAGIMAAAVF